jgi:hypothetical protein
MLRVPDSAGNRTAGPAVTWAGAAACCRPPERRLGALGRRFSLCCERAQIMRFCAGDAVPETFTAVVGSTGAVDALWSRKCCVAESATPVEDDRLNCHAQILCRLAGGTRRATQARHSARARIGGAWARAPKAAIPGSSIALGVARRPGCYARWRGKGWFPRRLAVACGLVKSLNVTGWNARQSGRKAGRKRSIGCTSSNLADRGGQCSGPPPSPDAGRSSARSA